MKMHDDCLANLMERIVKMVHIAKVHNREDIYHQIFAYLSDLDFEQSNARIFGDTLAMTKQYINNDDPYGELKQYYNHLLLLRKEEYEKQMSTLDNALFYATIANVFEKNPIHNKEINQILEMLQNVQSTFLDLDDRALLKEDLKHTQHLLYIGDNSGEAFFDYLLVKKIKELYPHISMTYVVRKECIENDCTINDVYLYDFHQYARVIDNGDDSFGTDLSRVSDKFLKSYQQADLVISKGQANYECLCHENKNIYFMMLVQYEKIARTIGVENETFVCMKKETEESVSFSFCI